MHEVHMTKDGKQIVGGMRLFWKSEYPKTTTDGVVVGEIFYHGDPMFLDPDTGEELWVPTDFDLFSSRAALEDFYSENKEIL